MWQIEIERGLETLGRIEELLERLDERLGNIQTLLEERLPAAVTSSESPMRVSSVAIGARTSPLVSERVEKTLLARYDLEPESDELRRTYKQVGEILGCSPGQARSRVARAERIIRWHGSSGLLYAGHARKQLERWLPVVTGREVVFDAT